MRAQATCGWLRAYAILGGGDAASRGWGSVLELAALVVARGVRCQGAD